MVLPDDAAFEPNELAKLLPYIDAVTAWWRKQFREAPVLREGSLVVAGSTDLALNELVSVSFGTVAGAPPPNAEFVSYPKLQTIRNASPTRTSTRIFSSRS